MNKTLASLMGAAVLSAMSTVALAQVCEQCGSAPPPPPPPPPPPMTTPGDVVTPGGDNNPFVCRVKGNAGIGNKGEGMRTERDDCDPGNSGAHNQAWRNADKHDDDRKGGKR